MMAIFIGIVTGLIIGYLAAMAGMEGIKNDEMEALKIKTAGDEIELNFFRLENERLRNERNRYREQSEGKNE